VAPTKTNSVVVGHQPSPLISMLASTIYQHDAINQPDLTTPLAVVESQPLPLWWGGVSRWWWWWWW
jgi:hypothetical protein